jgi:hypothetical protein
VGNQPDRIEDIDSFKKLRDDINSMEQFQRALPVVRPFLKLLGVNAEQLEEMETTLSQVGTIATDAQALATLPDHFNAIFASRGWIMYEMMNVEVAQNAVTKAEAGDIDEATINIHITWMKAVNAFQPRVLLARKALDDYVAGRYHASVPVVLALLDGMVNDLGRRGFFAEGVNLEAWDSIAAHSSGLAELAKVLGRTRQKRTTEQISIPYRNGILHGMDLGYDNKMVAAKAWAALFATQGWAVKVEKGEVNKPSEQPKKGWGDLLRQINENNTDKALLNAWTPRNIQVGVDIPVSGEPNAYEHDTPEKKLVEFLSYWSKGNYGHMARCLPVAEQNRMSKVAGELRAHYETSNLRKFKLLDLEDRAAAVTIIKIKLVCEQNGIQKEREVDFRLLNEDVSGRPVARGKSGSKWSLYTAYV